MIVSFSPLGTTNTGALCFATAVNPPLTANVCASVMSPELDVNLIVPATAPKDAETPVTTIWASATGALTRSVLPAS